MNLGGMEAIAQEVAGKAILDHAKDTERKLVSALPDNSAGNERERKRGEARAEVRTINRCNNTIILALDLYYYYYNNSYIDHSYCYLCHKTEAGDFVFGLRAVDYGFRGI